MSFRNIGHKCLIEVLLVILTFWNFYCQNQFHYSSFFQSFLFHRSLDYYGSKYANLYCFPNESQFIYPTPNPPCVWISIAPKSWVKGTINLLHWSLRIVSVEWADWNLIKTIQDRLNILCRPGANFLWTRPDTIYPPTAFVLICAEVTFLVASGEIHPEAEQL